MPQYTLSDYIQLIDSFVRDEMSAPEFEGAYLQLFKDDPTIRPEAEFDILDRLFCDVDAYCSDPDLRDNDDLDEEQLRACARSALERLRTFSTGILG